MRYQTIAINAATLASQKKVNPVEAWNQCAKNEYPDSINSQNKGCPKDAFLGLCQEGKLKGIPIGNYTKSRLNREYAISAINIIAYNKDKVFTSAELWRAVLMGLIADTNKRHNYQMDVVLALWNKNFINI